MSRKLLLPAGAVLMAMVAVVVLRLQPSPPKPRSAYKTAAGQTAETSRKRADVLYATKPKEAKKAYLDFVAQHAKDRNKEVQDEVGLARIRLGYLESKEKDFDQARTYFKQASTEYAGTGKKGADFGGIPDQAAYQAAVCLAAKGKKAEAEREFVRFMKDYKDSPLVHAAFRRLSRLHDGEPKPEHEALLASAVESQQAHIRRELAMCGPRALAYFLELGGQKHGYKDLAKLCGTNDSGTTLQGMAKGLKTLGYTAKGLRLNRKDFTKLATPAIWLSGRHYTVVLEIDGDTAKLYDPMDDREHEAKLPAEDDTEFIADVLTVSKPLGASR